MADFIKKETGLETDFKVGGGGIFDVFVDNRLIYSKHQSGRFPEEREIGELLEGH